MEGLESMAFVSNAMSLVTYFFGYMFSITKSATTLSNFLGTSFLLPLFGGIINDTYLSRFQTCLLFACMELLGFGILAVQAKSQKLRHIPCKDLAVTQMSECKVVTGGQIAMIYSGLYLVALGTGGIKVALPVLGADQFDEKDPKDASQLSSFFNWFLLSNWSFIICTIRSIIGVTFIVWIGAY